MICSLNMGWISDFFVPVFVGLMALLGSFFAIKEQFKQQERLRDQEARAFFGQIVDEQVRCIERILKNKTALFTMGMANIAKRAFEENKSLFLGNYSKLPRNRERNIRNELVDGFRKSTEWIYVLENNLGKFHHAKGQMDNVSPETLQYKSGSDALKQVNDEFDEMFSELEIMKINFEQIRSELGSD